MAVIEKDLGPVSAYAVAVAHGYTGTEAEWEALIANSAINAQSAGASATAAAASAQEAAQQKTQAQAQATAAQAHATQASNFANTAGQANSYAHMASSNAAVSAANASNAQTAAEAAQAAAEAAVTGAEAAQAAAEAAVTDAQTAKTAAETAAATAAAAYGTDLLADDYSTSKTYAVGDYVIYSGNLYRCTTAITTAEAWTAAHWTRAQVGPDLDDLKSAISIGEYIYFTDDILWSSSGEISSNTSYRASKQLMTIDAAKPWLKLSNYESDRIDLVFFNASGSFISPRQTLYNDSPLFINIVDKAPEGAVYFSVSIRKTTNKPYAKLITAEEWVGEYNGYVDTNGKIRIGDVGNSVYKMKILPVHSGDIVTTESAGSNGIYVLAFYDSAFTFINGIQYLAADITNYKAIAPADGYAIASSATASFNDFALSIETVNDDDAEIVPDSHYPYYIYNGAVSSTETYYLSNCIVVPKGKVLMVSANCGTAAAVLSDGQTNANIATGYGTIYDYWVSYYANETKIIRICWRPGYGDGLKAYTITPKKQLNGKRLLGIGDSYFAGNNLITDAYAKNHVWLNLLAMRNNMTIQNYGVNGTTIAECSAMSGTGTNPDSSNVAISDRIDRITDAFDVIFFEGGRNDFSNGIPIGTIELSNTDRTTFSGAVQYIINKIISLNAEAIVVGHPCWVSANGAEHSITHLTQTDYKEAFEDVCDANGIKCVDTGNCGIAVTQSSFREKYFMTATDVSHLNADGHERYVGTIEQLFD